MPEPITIPIEQSRRYRSGDRGRLEIDGQLQSDAIRFWSQARDRLGLGHGRLGQGMLGRGRSLGLGNGALGRGRLGQGARIIAYGTRSDFKAEDYAIRAKARDALGHVGDFTAELRHPHRPTPPAPAGLAITPGTSTLSWSWSED